MVSSSSTTRAQSALPVTFAMVFTSSILGVCFTTFPSLASASTSTDDAATIRTFSAAFSRGARNHLTDRGLMVVVCGVTFVLSHLALLVCIRKGFLRRMQSNHPRNSSHCPASFDTLPPVPVGKNGRRRLNRVVAKAEALHRPSTPTSRPTVGPSTMANPAEDVTPKPSLVPTPTKRRAPHLFNMNVVAISWLQCLWGAYFVGIPIALSYCCSFAMFKGREFLCCLGLTSTSMPTDPSQMVADLFLETSLAIFFKDIDYVNGNAIARFILNDVPIWINRSPGEVNFETREELAVWIDLSNRRLHRATLSGQDEELSPADTLTLVAFLGASWVHPKIHAYANWGIDPAHKEDAYIRRLSSITALMNCYGSCGYPEQEELQFRLGLTESKANFASAFRRSTQHAMISGVPVHDNIYELKRWSSLVSFIVPLRVRFHRIFRKHSNRFLGMHPEAVFVGSVMHSLDHKNFERIACNARFYMHVNSLVESFWPRSDFRSMQDMVRASIFLTSDVPFLGSVFARRMRDSKDPFHQQVYQEASKIDNTMADMMDVCIAI